MCYFTTLSIAKGKRLIKYYPRVLQYDNFTTFIPTTAQQFDTKIYIKSYSKPLTCFELFRSSSGRYSTKKKKNATVANYDKDVQLYVSIMLFVIPLYFDINTFGSQLIDFEHLVTPCSHTDFVQFFPYAFVAVNSSPYNLP
jgi:hypothetical protein